MSYELSPDQSRVIDKLITDGLFLNQQEALDRAVDLLREEAESLEDLRDSLASIDRGEGIPLSEFMAEMRAKYGLRK